MEFFKGLRDENWQNIQESASFMGQISSTVKTKCLSYILFKNKSCQRRQRSTSCWVKELKCSHSVSDIRVLSCKHVFPVLFLKFFVFVKFHFLVSSPALLPILPPPASPVPPPAPGVCHCQPRALLGSPRAFAMLSLVSLCVQSFLVRGNKNLKFWRIIIYPVSAYKYFWETLQHVSMVLQN